MTLAAVPGGFREGAVRVVVPATSANLGPGFDALGLALDLVDEVTASVAPDGLCVTVTGEGESLARDERHLVVRAMRRTFDLVGGQPPGLRLDCVNRIPHGRGLGSSAAAIVAGVLAARGLVTGGDGVLRPDDVLALAADIEGHPDNVAPALLGGLTIAWAGDAGDAGDAGARALGLRCDARIRPVVLVPPFEASTEQARGLLPDSVPHADAAANAAAAALLVAALTGAPEHLFPATRDRLHQRYRAPAVPESAALVDRLRGTGLAATISGAGPTVLVLARDDGEVARVRAATPPGWRCEALSVRAVGASVGPAPG